MFTNLYQLQVISAFECRQHQGERDDEPVLEEIHVSSGSKQRLAPKVLSLRDKLTTIFRSRVTTRSMRSPAV